MKVYLCYERDYNGCDVFKNIVKIVDDETKALVWREEVEPTDDLWREYEEKEVES